VADSSRGVTTWTEESNVMMPGAMVSSQPATKREEAAMACSKGVPVADAGPFIELELSMSTTTAAWGSAAGAAVASSAGAHSATQARREGRNTGAAPHEEGGRGEGRLAGQ
jgi:hypothetical protein